MSFTRSSFLFRDELDIVPAVGIHFIAFINLKQFLDWYFGDKGYADIVDDLDNPSHPVITPLYSKLLLYGRVDKEFMWRDTFDDLFSIEDSEIKLQHKKFVERSKERKRFMGHLQDYSYYESFQKDKLRRMKEKAEKFINEGSFKYFAICDYSSQM